MIRPNDIAMADRLHQIGLVQADRLAKALQFLSGSDDDLLTLSAILIEAEIITREDVENIIYGEENYHKLHGHQILDTVGRGAFAWVYKARQAASGKIIAIKVIRKKWVRKLRAVRRMKREAQIGSIIRHPNVVSVFGKNFNVERAFMLLEYVDGTTLEKLIKYHGALRKSIALSIGIDIAEALTGLEAHHVVHRDIKPSNILISARGTAKLSDFGVAKRLAVDDGLPRNKLSLGTRGYVSPEQIEDPRWVDIRSDIYSLGVALFDMLTGNISSRFKRSEKAKDMKFVPPDLTKISSALGNGVIGVIKRMTDKEPSRRYSTPQELVRVLRGLLGDFSDLDTSGVQDCVAQCRHKDSTGQLWLESGSLENLETGDETTFVSTSTKPTADEFEEDTVFFQGDEKTLT